MHCIVTNHHVFKAKEVASGAKVAFDYEKGRDEIKYFELDPERFFVNDQSLDYAICAVKDGRNTSRVPIPIKSTSTQVGDELVIVQHPNGVRKVVAEGKVTGFSADGRDVYYDVDTLPGSSGSPVFAKKTWQLVALHKQSNPQNGQPMNGGTPLSMILSDLRQKRRDLKVASKMDEHTSKYDCTAVAASSLDHNSRSRYAYNIELAIDCSMHRLPKKKSGSNAKSSVSATPRRPRTRSDLPCRLCAKHVKAHRHSFAHTRLHRFTCARTHLRTRTSTHMHISIGNMHP